MPAYADIAKMIDHSLLNPTLTDQEIIAGCELAKAYNVASVCVRPSDVVLAHSILSDSDVLVTTVIGFPHGSTTTAAKLAEAREAIDNGCKELDIVLHIGKLRSGELEYVEKDLEPIIRLAHVNDVKVKVIFENTYLTKEQIITATQICNKLNADWVKTSTGYAGGGATDEDLQLMRQYALPHIQVKAAGGVRTLQRALEVRALGCSRFGATATKTILDELVSGQGQESASSVAY